jgi:hypothetical protein
MLVRNKEPTHRAGKRENKTSSELRLRLIRDNDIPASHDLDERYILGIQDKDQQIFAGKRGTDGKLVFDFSVKVQAGNADQHPVFTGRFASGPPSDRFVYLSWRSVRRNVYINRVKARLSNISWAMVRAAQKADRSLVAEMSGRGPGDPRRHVEWRLD